MKALTVSALVLTFSSAALASTPVDSRLVRAADGKTVVCESKSDAFGANDGFLLYAPQVRLLDSTQLGVKVRARFVVCGLNSQGQASWIDVAPGAPLEYTVPTAAGRTSHVRIVSEDFELLTLNMGSQALATAVFDREGSAYAADYEIDLLRALSGAERLALERGEFVRLMLDLTLRAKRFYSVDGGPAEVMGQSTGGSYYLTVDLRRVGRNTLANVVSLTRR